MINFKGLMQYLDEAGYAATARAGEREWHSQVTDTVAAKKPTMPSTGDNGHREKMFGIHTKLLAAAKAKGDTSGIKYHTGKVKQYGA